MQGFHAPELACGDIDAAFTVLQAGRSEVLHAQAQHQMTPDEWGLVTRDFELGVQFLQLGLALKLANWTKLPWRLAGLAHQFEYKARAAARSCLHLWDSLRSDSVEHHHPVSRWWLETHRREVQDFANGGSRVHWSQELQEHLACFRFWPCSERIVEATHKNAKKYAGFDRATPLTKSTSLRSEVSLHGAAQENLPLLLGCIDRKIKDVVRTIGFGQHPTIHALLEAKAHSTKLQTAMAKILYRADALDMFHDTSAEQRMHHSLHGKRKRASAAAAGIAPAIPLSLATVMGSALIDHLRRSVKPGAIISFPKQALPCQPISRALMGGSSTAGLGSHLQLVDRSREDDTFPFSDDDDTTFCKVLHMTPAAWRTVSIPAHQGGAFVRAGDSIRTTHTRI